MTDSVVQPSSPLPPCDLDGTLIDSVYQHVLAWQQGLTEFGIDLSVSRLGTDIRMAVVVGDSIWDLLAARRPAPSGWACFLAATAVKSLSGRARTAYTRIPPISSCTSMRSEFAVTPSELLTGETGDQVDRHGKDAGAEQVGQQGVLQSRSTSFIRT
jgi:hypothetical protein